MLTPLQYFRMFWTQDLTHMMALWSKNCFEKVSFYKKVLSNFQNQQEKRKSRENTPGLSREREKTPTRTFQDQNVDLTASDIDVFCAALITMGLWKASNTRDYWNRDTGKIEWRIFDEFQAWIIYAI